MTWGGWITMILSVGTVTCLFAWCLYKVLTTQGETEHLHGTTDDLPDQPT
jgi:hypothetical protein